MNIRSLGTALIYSAITLACFAPTGIIISEQIHRKSEERVDEQNINLERKCMQIAAGKDSILDAKEGLSLARGLGYTGAISPMKNQMLFDSL